MADIISFPKQTMFLDDNPVPVVCEIAGQTLKNVVILGETEDGEVKMMTTEPDIADILFYLESAKLAILSGGMNDGD